MPVHRIPFSEEIKENGSKKISNSSFINFDFSFLPADKLSDVLSNEVLCEPIDCDELNAFIDNIGIDKRCSHERFERRPQTY